MAINFENLSALSTPNGKVHEIFHNDDLLFLKEESFVNRVPYSIDTDGSVFNGCGYLNGYRLKSTGEIAEQDNSCVTGFIRARAGEIVEFSGAKWLYDEVDRYDVGSDRICYLTIYDKNFNHIDSSQNSNDPAYWDIGEITKNLLNDVKTITLPNDNNIYYIRINCLGDGANLVLTIRETLDVNPSYSNKVPTSIDTDKSIYNGCGYLDGYRLNSSGNLTEAGISTVTGFIPAKGGDLIRISGVPWMYKDTSTNYLAAYNSSFSFIGSTYSMYGTYGTSMWEWIAGTPNHGAAIKLKNLSNIAYVRCSAIGNNLISTTGYIRGVNAIVTVNEKIIPPTQKRTICTNLVPTSIDTNGSIYQGVGYIQNYRVNSTGGLTAFKNLVTTGYIKYKIGCKIRMCDVSWLPELFGESDNTDLICYIAFFDKNFNILGSVNVANNGDGASRGVCGEAETKHHIVTDNFGETLFNVYFTDESQIAYFRITAYGYGGDMIVTIDEKIVEGLVP